MLDKLLFNNQLLSSKGKVQKAKVNTINKLVHKIRRIKSILDKNPENSKIKIKLKRTVEILACIKKIKNVDFIKKALLSNKKPQIIITNGLSSPEEIAEANLIQNKIIIDIVNQFKKIFHLNDKKNPNWRNEIIELSKRKQKIMLIEERIKKRQERKDKKDLDKKRNQWLVENLPDDVIQKNESSIDLNMKSENINDTKELESKKIIKLKRKRINTSIEEEDIVESIKNENPEPLTIVDPFFVTSNGKNYLSTVIIDRVQPEPPNDGLVRKERRNISKTTSFRNNRNQINHNRNMKKSIIENDKFKRKPIISENNLHPSWAAKQKHKKITEFQGKKINFEENLIETTKVKKDSQPEDLHPSWIAKQKMKPTIKDFSGTKIVFEE